LLPAALVLAFAPSTAARGGEAPWAPPAEGDCGVRAAIGAGDASPVAFAPGDVVTHDRLAALEPLLPPEVWEQRQLFFFEGMRLELGPCHRRYAPPPLFDEATRANAGRARLLANGGLEHEPAGLPFDPAALAADDPELGQKWAWNAARRWAGAGRFGKIRLAYVDAGEITARLVGEHFLAILLARADLPAPAYRPAWAKGERWVAGGRTRDPTTGWHCAFRHFRASGDDADPTRSDDLFFFSSAMQKPSRVGWDPELPLTTCAYGRGFHLPRGGKVGRYRWRLAGVRDLVAPINATGGAHPDAPERSFGPSGASLASDRWDLRRALVLEAGTGGRPMRLYVDLETLFPLYHVDGGAILQHAGRWSEDRPDYPRWPDAPERPVRVIDPVVTVLAIPASGEVVRVEAWSTVAVPPPDRVLRSLVSESALARER
jgi:hypothetical protein